MSLSPKHGLESLLSVLDRLEIPYALAGSVASSVHGRPRATAGIDIVADIREEHVAELVRLTVDSFYCDEPSIRDAIRRGRSFNLIHQGSAFKFDLFPAGDDPLNVAELERRAYTETPVPGGSVECAIISAEDVILSKLRWYRLSGGSERQWDDVLGILQRKREKLDYEYLTDGARKLHVEELLARLFDSPGPK